MRILVACEKSQAVCVELRNRGHEAFSCDTQECSGEHPEWHIKGDVLEQLDKGWDMMIAFPPCTFLSNVANRFYKKKYNLQYSIFGFLDTRDKKRKEAYDFVMRLFNAPINKIAIENPVGIIGSRFRKADQIVQPYFFGDSFQKRTCLWLKNLPLLKHTNIVSKGEMTEHRNGRIMPKWYHTNHNNCKTRQESRAVTFPGIAKAMAEQWTKNHENKR